MSDVDMGRVSIQMPVETLENMRQWAKAAGLKPGQFNSVALAMGARQLAIHLVPEQVISPDALKAFSDALEKAKDNPNK